MGVTDGNAGGVTQSSFRWALRCDPALIRRKEGKREMTALPVIRDPRKTSLGGVLPKYDIKPRQRWTPLYKAIVAEAIRASVLTPDEARDQFCLTALELKRWVELLETQGVRGLAANNFQDNLPEKLDDLPTIDNGPLFI